MKIVRRILLAGALLLIVIGVGVYLSIDRILKQTVESQASSSLNLTTTLGGARLALFGGNLKLDDLQVGSPKGFTAPQMLGLGAADLTVKYSQLRSNPIHVTDITLKQPKLVIEQVDGKLNFKAAMDGMPQTPPGQPQPKTGDNKEPVKLIIDSLNVTGATVIVRPGNSIPGLPPEITVPIPDINLKNIGNADGAENGAAIKDVVMQVVTIMADSASKSASLDALKGMLQNGIQQVTAQLGPAFQGQLANLQKNLPGGVGQALGDLTKNPGDLIKNPGGALQGVLGGKKGDGATTQPDPDANPAKSLEQGLGGLFKQDKKKSQ